MAIKEVILGKNSQDPVVRLTTKWEHNAAKALGLPIQNCIVVFTGISAFRDRDIAFDRITQLAGELKEGKKVKKVANQV